MKIDERVRFVSKNEFKSRIKTMSPGELLKTERIKQFCYNQLDIPMRQCQKKS